MTHRQRASRKEQGLSPSLLTSITLSCTKPPCARVSICFMYVRLVLSWMCLLRCGFQGGELWFLMLQNRRAEDSDTHKYTTSFAARAATEIGIERQKEEGAVNWRSPFIWLISCFFPEAQREKENLVSETISAAWLLKRSTEGALCLVLKIIYMHVWLHRMKLVSHLRL